ncbi:MAG TPA: HEAT repeat domain-containing protein [Nostocaceae cyanobacterium]|nr:HEAT repeat domain-containing protein [Nostocaceae cyanobacterium]
MVKQIIDNVYNFWCCYPNDNSIESVLIALAQTKSQMLDHLQKDMSSKDSAIKLRAIIPLSKIGSAELLDKLILLIKDNEESHIKWIVASSLGRLGDIKALDVLLNIGLNDKDYYVRASSAWALGEIGSIEALNGLIKTLRCDQEGSVRKAAVSAIIKIGDGKEKILDLLIKVALNDEEWYVRQEALFYLVKLGNSQILDILKKEANHSEQYIREEIDLALNAEESCIGLLNTTNNDAQVDNLIEDLKGRNFDERMYEIEVLDKIGTLEILDKLLQNPEIDIYSSDIYVLARKLAVRFSKEKVNFIPFYPELLGQNSIYLHCNIHPA